MISSNEFKAIADLDLDPIKVKLMHKESGEGWSLEKVNAVEVEYRRFLYLMKTFPNEVTAPQVEVDVFWHYHILDTMKYAADCQEAFGYFLHHFPYIGMRGEDDEQAQERAGQRMRELYEATFGAADAQQAPAGMALEISWCGRATPVSATAWCGRATPASPVSATAWCGRATPASPVAATAWCGRAAPSQFYGARPALAAAA
jgi:hypothetical protein